MMLSWLTSLALQKRHFYTDGKHVVCTGDGRASKGNNMIEEEITLIEVPFQKVSVKPDAIIVLEESMKIGVMAKGEETS